MNLWRNTLLLAAASGLAVAGLSGCQPTLTGPKSFAIDATSRAPDRVVIQSPYRFYHYEFPGEKAEEFCPRLNPQVAKLTPPWPTFEFEQSQAAWVSRNPAGEKNKGQVSLAVCVAGRLTPVGAFIPGTDKWGVTLLVLENL